MKQRKNRISTFSSPSDYVLPKVISSEIRENKSVLQRRFPYLYKSLVDSNSFIGAKENIIMESEMVQKKVRTKKLMKEKRVRKDERF